MRFGGFFLALLAATRLGGQQPAVWRLTPELRIGDAARGKQYEFARVTSVTPGPDGSVLVIDGSAQEIRVFDARGEFARTIGRNGSGPGEFRSLAAAGFLGDTLWAADFGLRRVSLFSNEGKIIATIPQEPSEPAKSPGQQVGSNYISAVLRGGRALGSAVNASAAMAGGPLPAIPVLLMTRGGRTIDTLAWLSTKNLHMAFIVGDRQTSSVQRFSDAPLSVIAPAADRVFIVDRPAATSARNATFRVAAVNVTGDTLWNRSYLYVPKRLDAASVDSVLSGLETSFTKLGLGLTRQQIRAKMFIPEFRTPVAAAFGTADGSLWLRREDGGTHANYTVIGPNGDLLATVALPRNVVLRSVEGTTAWGVETDEGDVPSVVRYRISK